MFLSVLGGTDGAGGALSPGPGQAWGSFMFPLNLSLSAPGCLAEFLKAISLAWRFLSCKLSCHNLLNPWRQLLLFSCSAQNSLKHLAPLGQGFQEPEVPLEPARDASSTW